MPHFATPSEASALSQAKAARMTINASWLIKLRWVAVFGQMFTIGVVRLILGVEIATTPLAVVLLLTGLSNIAFTYICEALRKRYSASPVLWEYTLFVVMLIDLLFLTLLLIFTGGMANPFALFYLVNLTLAAIVLPPRSAWGLVVVTTACIAALLFLSYPLPDMSNWTIAFIQHQGAPVTVLELGTFAALLTCTMVIVYFTTRLNAEIAFKDADLRRREIQEARSEKLEALGTLAAGAAHELSTPLSTIAVVAKEVQRELEGTDLSPEIKEDISLIRGELDRCRTILNQMSAQAGQATGEPIIKLNSETLLNEVLGLLDSQHRGRVTLTNQVPEVTIKAPLHLLAQAIRGLVKNAIDATPKSQKIILLAEATPYHLVLTLQDKGSGMPPEILSRIGEPFFTTKEPGAGTGLGIFLARNVIEKLLGDLSIESSTAEGTTVIVRVPRGGK